MVIDRSAEGGEAAAQRAKTWVTVFGVAWPPAWTMPLQVVGLVAPLATGFPAASLG